MQDLAQSARLGPLKESSANVQDLLSHRRVPESSRQGSRRHGRPRHRPPSRARAIARQLPDRHARQGLSGVPGAVLPARARSAHPAHPTLRGASAPGRITGRGHPGLGRTRARRSDCGREAGHGGEGLARAAHRSRGARLLRPSLRSSEADGRPRRLPGGRRHRPDRHRQAGEVRGGNRLRAQGPPRSSMPPWRPVATR